MSLCGYFTEVNPIKATSFGKKEQNIWGRKNYFNYFMLWSRQRNSDKTCASSTKAKQKIMFKKFKSVSYFQTCNFW